MHPLLEKLSCVSYSKYKLFVVVVVKVVDNDARVNHHETRTSLSGITDRSDIRSMFAWMDI